MNFLHLFTSPTSFRKYSIEWFFLKFHKNRQRVLKIYFCILYIIFHSYIFHQSHYFIGSHLKKCCVFLFCFSVAGVTRWTTTARQKTSWPCASLIITLVRWAEVLENTQSNFKVLLFKRNAACCWASVAQIKGFSFPTFSCKSAKDRHLCLCLFYKKKTPQCWFRECYQQGLALWFLLQQHHK